MIGGSPLNGLTLPMAFDLPIAIRAAALLTASCPYLLRSISMAWYS